MLTTRELKGSKDQIVAQIQAVSGQILSAVLVVDEPASVKKMPNLSEEELAKLRAEMDADTVSAPHVDYSREAMYTRMPGE